MNDDLTLLTQILPLPESAAIELNWRSVEDSLGHAIPDDYKELVAVYGSGLVDNYLLLLGPSQEIAPYDISRISAQREEANESLWEFDDRPQEMETEGNRLTCWATTDNGEYLYWLVRPNDGPATRPILLNSQSGEHWERYNMTATQFLTAALRGDVNSEILWDNFPLPVHTFTRAGEL